MLVVENIQSSTLQIILLTESAKIFIAHRKN